MKKKIHLVGGARPNFMKLAPIVRALDKQQERFEYRIVHTGQHYDREMSDVFFDELGIPKPDFYLEAGGGSHAQQTAKIMVAYETLCNEQDKPDLCLVVGDVNSTIACSLVAKKLGVAVAHVEAGLRSGDRAMPEEINRLATDAISDYFFVTEESGEINLLKEGQPQEKVFFVGHVMIDNLFYQRDQLSSTELAGQAAELKAKYPRYGVVTLHRPSNVDDQAALTKLIGALREVAAELPLIFPVHPRTRGNIEKFGIELGDRIITTPPLSYMEFLSLWKDAAIVMTDSGGLQEETTGLGVPCLTLRENTERPVTISDGTNTLVGTSPDMIVREARKVLAGQGKQGRQPKFWDGKAAERIVDILYRELDRATSSQP
ncbi:UDP-N-acetylglucosamine 2-epimerase (non-hydrolyzing) [Chitinivorax tropicus]|uniref:UDP-N-acetylglucosamine 2-epimerase (Non-hydrolyzing) n=1 Tax=Chitinivorax tropicus TaxID=714531 RepID=A0A840MSY2_9PROT|nr:UDP-N-acetylglucosamine 2-epimerase (non-hydrolyzing) [Chitinivorax tropicus]